MVKRRSSNLRFAITPMVAGVCAAMPLLSATHAEPETLRGSATAVDGRTLQMDGKRIRLANIAVPEPGDKCILRGKVRDCGRFSRLGLTELVVAATIECQELTQHTHSCKTEDGYDLALGQIHAGWAVPTKSAPRHYVAKMNEVRNKRRMLWSALHPDGRPGYFATLMKVP